MRRITERRHHHHSSEEEEEREGEDESHLRMVAVAMAAVLTRVTETQPGSQYH
jgi:hypothetical protein